MYEWHFTPWGQILHKVLFLEWITRTQCFVENCCCFFCSLMFTKECPRTNLSTFHVCRSWQLQHARVCVDQSGTCTCNASCCGFCLNHLNHLRQDGKTCTCFWGSPFSAGMNTFACVQSPVINIQRRQAPSQIEF